MGRGASLGGSGTVGGRCDSAPVAGLWKSGVRRRLRSAFGQATAQTPDSVSGEYERLAFEAAQRALDKQERLLEELRSRDRDSSRGCRSRRVIPRP